jgi:hypothetical protein
MNLIFALGGSIALWRAHIDGASALYGVCSVSYACIALHTMVLPRAPFFCFAANIGFCALQNLLARIFLPARADLAE